MIVFYFLQGFLSALRHTLHCRSGGNVGGESTDLAALDRDLVFGAGNAFWCNRVKDYVTRDQCVAGYLECRGSGRRIPCLECSKVLHWAKGRVPIKNGKPRVAKVLSKKQEKSTMGIKKETGSKNVILVDFSEYPELLEGITASARERFRTPDQQLLYLVQHHLYGKKASHPKRVA